MKRRAFLYNSGMSLAGLALSGRGLRSFLQSQVMTVTGPVDPQSLGLTLIHEHILVDFIGADKVSRDRYDVDEVAATALPHLKRVYDLGCRTFVDCTPAWLGRDAVLLQRLSKESGLHLITNTGFYGARNHQFLPGFVVHETPEQIAARWIKEFDEGIDGTKIKPGFIKIGVDAGELSSLNIKIVSAAALTHLKTGLTIGAHTGDGKAAMQELELIEKHGVKPEAFIWIHAQSEKDKQLHIAAAKRGCWVEFDGINPGSIERHIELIKSMRDAGLLHRVLISQDSGWYRVGEPGGGNYRGYDTMFTTFVPALSAAGFDTEEIDQLLVINPRMALTLEIRR